jgi:hypothetical protein
VFQAEASSVCLFVRQPTLPRRQDRHPAHHPEILDADPLGQRRGIDRPQPELLDHPHDLGSRLVKRDGGVLHSKLHVPERVPHGRAALDAERLVPEEAAHLDIPFERRVTNQLIEALGATRQAADQVLTEGSNLSEVFEEAVDRGVSANLCDAITRMGGEQIAANVQVTVDWAASRPPTRVETPAVTFEAASLPVIQEAVQSLRQLGPFEDEAVEGFVGRLVRGKEDEIGTIVIDARVHGGQRNVHVELPDEQYGLAISAHDDRRPVRIRGTLSKRGRSWVLSDPGQLRLEEPES